MSELILKNVRVSYLACFEPRETPSGDMKYSASILVPESDTEQLKNIDDAVQAAIDKGLQDNKFSKVHVGSLRRPPRDGSAEYESGARGEEYNGHKFLNANSNNPPGVVDERRQPILDPNEFYSGCYAHVHVTFFPYNTAGNRGIGVGLNNLMRVGKGDRLDGRKSADQAFKDIEVPDEESDDEL